MNATESVLYDLRNAGVREVKVKPIIERERMYFEVRCEHDCNEYIARHGELQAAIEDLDKQVTAACNANGWPDAMSEAGHTEKDFM